MEVWKKTPIEYTNFYIESLRRTQDANQTTTVSRSDSMQVHPSSSTRLSEERRPRLMLPRFPRRITEEKVSHSSSKEKLSISKLDSQALDAENAFKKECSISEPSPSQHPSEAIPSSPKVEPIKKKSEESLLLTPDTNTERRASTLGPLPGSGVFTSPDLLRQETDDSSILTEKSGSFWF